VNSIPIGSLEHESRRTSPRRFSSLESPRTEFLAPGRSRCRGCGLELVLWRKNRPPTRTISTASMGIAAVDGRARIEPSAYGACPLDFFRSPPRRISGAGTRAVPVAGEAPWVFWRLVNQASSWRATYLLLAPRWSWSWPAFV